MDPWTPQCSHSKDLYKQLYVLSQQNGPITVNAQGTTVAEGGTEHISVVSIARTAQILGDNLYKLLKNLSERGCKFCASDLSFKGSLLLNDEQNAEKSVLYLATAYKIEKKLCLSEGSNTEQDLKKALTLCLCKQGDNWLHHFSQYGDVHIVEYLLKTKLKLLFEKNEKGRNPIHLAARQGNDKIIEKLLLLSNKILIDEQDKKGNTPLHLATKKVIRVELAESEKYRRCIRKLLEKDADINLLNSQQLSAKEISKKSGNQEIIRLFNINESSPICHKAISLKASLDYFVKRNNEAKQLEEKLLPCKNWRPTDSVRWFALYGPPGIGKSELACSFGNQHIEKYSLVYWINCETEASINESYRNLAKLIGIYIHDKATTKEIQESLFLKLENHKFKKPWLLIFDNVEKAISYPQRGGYILGTSRTDDVGPSKRHCLKLSTFKEEEAIDLLKEITVQNDETNMKSLANKLGCYPIIISNAAFYICAHEITISEYLKDLNEDKKIIFYHGNAERYPVEIQKAWSLTFEKLKATNQAAFNWLSLCAYFNPINIPKQWIQDWLESITELKNLRLRQETGQIIHVLKKYGLIQYNIQVESFSLHRIIQEMTQATEKNLSLSYNKAFMFLLKIGLAFDQNNLETWLNAKIWLPHAIVMTQNELFKDTNPENRGVFWRCIGRIKANFGDLIGALEAYENALTIFQDVNLTNSIEFIRLIQDKAIALRILGEYNNSIEYLESCLKSVEKIDLSDKQSIELEILNEKGYALFLLGKYQEALEIYEYTLKVGQANDDCQVNSNIATSLSGISVVLSHMNKLQNSFRHGEEALIMKQKIYGSKPHPNVARSLNFIGTTLYFLKRFDESLKYNHESLEMRKKIYGTELHPDLAASLQGIGISLQSTGNFQESIVHLKQALEMKEKIYGSKPHPSIAWCLYYLGNSVHSLGNHKEALIWIENALTMQKQLYQNGLKIDIAYSLGSLSSIHYSLQNYQDALKSSLESLKIIVDNLKIKEGYVGTAEEDVVELLEKINAILVHVHNEDQIQETLTALKTMLSDTNFPLVQNSLASIISEHSQSFILCIS